MTVLPGPHSCAVVELQNCTRTYPGPPEFRALQPTTLVIRPGEYVTLMGPSGSGKSTLLNLIGLLDTATAGTVLFDGTDTASLCDAERAFLRGRRIGFIFQSFNLLPYRTVTENVLIALVYNGTRRRLRHSLAMDALRRVGVHHRREALAMQLSGGERQRVAIARAVVAGPTLLLCDEPTGNLDSRSSDVVMNELDRLHGDGLTIVVVTHNPLIAERADRRLEMRDGILTAAATDPTAAVDRD